MHDTNPFKTWAGPLNPIKTLLRVPDAREEEGNEREIQSSEKKISNIKKAAGKFISLSTAIQLLYYQMKILYTLFLFVRCQTIIDSPMLQHYNLWSLHF